MMAPIDHDSVLWTLPADGERAAGTLVLLHGYGSTERALTEQIAPLLPDQAIAALRAPIAEGPGYAWVSLQQSLTTLGADALLGRANAIAGTVLDWLAVERPAEPVGVLGVSQGAVLAVHLLRSAPHRVAYAVNLAGYVLSGELATDAQLRRERPPVFWGRGAIDDVIPQAEIRRTRHWLPSHSTLTAATYEAGHEPAHQAFEDAASFVRQARRRER